MGHNIEELKYISHLPNFEFFYNPNETAGGGCLGWISYENTWPHAHDKETNQILDYLGFESRPPISEGGRETPLRGGYANHWTVYVRSDITDEIVAKLQNLTADLGKTLHGTEAEAQTAYEQHNSQFFAQTSAIKTDEIHHQQGVSETKNNGINI